MFNFFILFFDYLFFDSQENKGLILMFIFFKI
jgi:hypothetical protein